MAEEAALNGEARHEPDHLEVIALEGIPEIRTGDDLAQIIVEALEATPNALPARDDDVLVVTQKVVSKAEGADRRPGHASSRAPRRSHSRSGGTATPARSSSCCGMRSASSGWPTGS